MTTPIASSSLVVVDLVTSCNKIAWCNSDVKLSTKSQRVNPPYDREIAWKIDRATRVAKIQHVGFPGDGLSARSKNIKEILYMPTQQFPKPRQFIVLL